MLQWDSSSDTLMPLIPVIRNRLIQRCTMFRRPSLIQFFRISSATPLRVSHSLSWKEFLMCYQPFNPNPVRTDICGMQLRMIWRRINNWQNLPRKWTTKNKQCQPKHHPQWMSRNNQRSQLSISDPRLVMMRLRFRAELFNFLPSMMEVNSGWLGSIICTRKVGFD